MGTPDSGGTTQDSAEPNGSTVKRQDDRLETARLRAINAVTVLVVILAIADGAGLAPHLDLGVFVTLAGLLASLLGVGSIIKLVGPK